MHNFDGIIFDIDGTLSSTYQLIYESFRHISKKYLNKTFTDAEIRNLFGPTEDVVLKQWNEDKFDEIKDDYYNFYSENHNMAALYPGIIDILNYIKSKKTLLSIYTGKGRAAATITLKKLDIYDYFDMIITGDDVSEYKPSAEGILKFITEYRLNKERVLMIGDSPSDVKAAHSGGVKIASALWDSYAMEEVLNLKSDYIFYEVQELEKFIKMNV
ncbi:MAG TPA: HAD family hydrolase [Ignavibacteria bacterium]|nr:HAD family hydrolase [Ignavibacteria bacterium]